MYAGFIRRAAAFVIDSIIVGIAGSLIGLVTGFLAALFLGTERGLGFYLFSSLLGIAVNLCYFAIFESSSWQATPGKKALGIKVTDLNGQRISFARATGRWAGKILSAAYEAQLDGKFSDEAGGTVFLKRELARRGVKLKLAGT